MKKLTLKWLEKSGACKEAVEQWQKEGCEPDFIKTLERCIKIKKFGWGNWLIVRHMTYKQYVPYAVFAAEQVIDLFEKKYPDDKRPREAIEAANACIKNPSAKNKKAADVAAGAARAAEAAGAAAGAARAAAWAAAGAAGAAAGAAAWAAEAARAAAWTAARAAGAAGAAAGAAEAAMQEKNLRYGIELLEA